jgi:beta-glucosidase
MKNLRCLRLFSSFALASFATVTLCAQADRGGAAPSADPATVIPTITEPAIYKDASQPVEKRVADLIRRMSLQEKARQLGDTAPAIERLGIPRYGWWNEALHGVARAGTATVFPQAIGNAATWDPALIKAMGDVIAVEGRAKYNDSVAKGNGTARYFGLTFWSPNINIFRDPRWGRGQETYGEDPFLTARMGVAFIQGVQGDDPTYYKALAAAKHYVVHSGPEPGRHTDDIHPSEVDLYDTYLPHFEAAVREGRVASVMGAYNRVNGESASASKFLLTDLLRTKWGFQGYVVSDCDSIKDIYLKPPSGHALVATAEEAAALALLAGMDLNCDFGRGGPFTVLPAAVAKGLVTEADVDRALTRVFTYRFKLGMFDPPEKVPFSKYTLADLDTPAHSALALQAARKSIVLLKNTGVLPLDPARLKRVAVIGPNATSIPALLGNYNGTPTAPVTVLAGIRAALGTGVEVTTTEGVPYVSGYGQRAAPRGARGARGAATPPFPTVPQLRTDLGLTADQVARITPMVEAIAKIQAENSADQIQANELRNQQLTAINAVLTEAQRTQLATLVAGGTVTPLSGPGTPEFTAALALAREADAVIFVGGLLAAGLSGANNPPGLEGEETQTPYDGFLGGDRTKIELPAIQTEMLKALHATGKPVIFVNCSGSAMAMPWEAANLPAIVQAWYPGQNGGTAIADILFGKINPSGRLPVTFYASTADLPDFKDYAMKNRTYRFFTGKPQFAFGHGLSYTKFAYAAAKVAAPTVASTGTIKLSVDVTNTGARDGDEVVQIYARQPGLSDPARPQQALVGFQRVTLAKGEKKTVEISIPATALRHWDTAKKDYVVDAAAYELRVGAASDDIRATATVSIAPGA